MKQIFQNFKTGKVETEDIPCPKVEPGHVLIRTRSSLISAGTERMVVELAKSSLLSKARQQPERVRQVLDMLKTNGFLSTLETVRAKLDLVLPLGYSNAGVILEVGAGVTNFAPGDRVVSNGSHAEIVRVPKNLCAKIPDTVRDEEAAFTVIGAIALQGIRLIQPTLGETLVVIGLGLIGLISVQILKAHGCHVLGTDYDPARCDLARRFGAETVVLSKGEDPVEAALNFSKGRGVDGVLITAATESSEPVHQAAQMCRKRGRIVLVGVTGLQLRRTDFYEKELSFQVSCSYGPGRYDPEYEEKGHDYPVGYVRWTEGRNFEAILDLMSGGKLDVSPLVTHRFKIEEAPRAYQLISSNAEPYLGILFTYDERHTAELRVQEQSVQLKPHVEDSSGAASHIPVIGFIGAGNFASRVLLPVLKNAGIRLRTIASSTGASATRFGRRFEFEVSTTEVDGIFADPEINTVFISTRHDTHAGFVLSALRSGKHIFVEKPLCIKREELDEIVATFKEIKRMQPETPLLMVGFNRRFAPQVIKIKELLAAAREPKSIIMTVNSGMIPPEHWTQDVDVGGGRILGEACHFIDLLRFLVGESVTAVQVTTMGGSGNLSLRYDKVTFTLSFADGSFGTVHYLANGHRSFPKERLEVFCGGRILQLDNFKRLRGYGTPGFKKMNLWRQDKGHANELAAFLGAVLSGGPAPIPFEELVEVTRVSFQVMEAAWCH